jgi:4-nitrophenyl phosphatase
MLSLVSGADWTTLRGVLIDLDGVVYTGSQAIPGAAAFLAQARVRGLRFLLVTNNSTASPEVVAQRLATMDIAVQPGEVLTSGQAAAAYVRQHSAAPPRVRIIGETGLYEAAREEGLIATEDGESVEWVLAGLDRAFTYEKLTAATRAIRSGARFVATNADALLPIEGGQVIPGAGSIVAAIQTATATEPVVVGKPQPALFDHGLRRLGGLHPAEVAMIGDRIDTDVLGGQRAGLRTILVLSGVTTARQAQVSAVQADAVASNLAAVADLLGWKA